MASSTPKCANPTCKTAPGPEELPKCSRCQTVPYCSRKCQISDWPSHKSICLRPNYIIEFQLHPDQITDPPVVRTLSCPSHRTFYALHLALQTAFKWAATHSFDFTVANPDYVADTDDGVDDLTRIVQERMAITQNGEQPASSPRKYLLRIIDPASSGRCVGDDHMHEGKRKHPQTVERESENLKLWQVFENTCYRDKKIVYTYDFGDNWEHFLTVKGRAPPTINFECVGGSGHYVAEDVGGFRGWGKLKAAYRTSRPDRKQRAKREWFQSVCGNADPQGLAGDRVNLFDKDQTTRDLAEMLDSFERVFGEALRRQEELKDLPWN
ncbi:hypothetical protein OQA88_3166 [Cercophora sp. LCS_1]